MKNCNEDFTVAEVILLCGVSGAGKTTCAKRLESKGFKRLTLDEYLWQSHGRSIAEMPLAKQREEAVKMQTVLISDMCRYIHEGKDVVVDFPMCKRPVRDHFRRVAEDAGAEVRLWFLDAPLEELQRRLSARVFKDANSLPVSAAQVASFFSNFSRPDADEDAKCPPLSYLNYGEETP